MTSCKSRKSAHVTLHQSKKLLTLVCCKCLLLWLVLSEARKTRAESVRQISRDTSVEGESNAVFFWLCAFLVICMYMYVLWLNFFLAFKISKQLNYFSFFLHYHNLRQREIVCNLQTVKLFFLFPSLP